MLVLEDGKQGKGGGIHLFDFRKMSPIRYRELPAIFENKPSSRVLSVVLLARKIW